ncbi:hypothetical protein DM02DRAFT_634812 [Periconia macrospinosa]|uniref:CENP-V/GFA domain-containing protein n=1 Tax=Periconia macrospinosa TaxID=97972 RepID=A0A2V1D577_9PLEO|nr:hypothetical protein DM02DRAFT_634812 [Periconia macrospinosa]
MATYHSFSNGNSNGGSLQLWLNPNHNKPARRPGEGFSMPLPQLPSVRFAVNLLIPTTNVRIKGIISPKVYSTKAASGNTSNRHFCPECGSLVTASPIFTTVTENPDITFVKGGLFPSQNVCFWSNNSLAKSKTIREDVSWSSKVKWVQNTYAEKVLETFGMAYYTVAATPITKNLAFERSYKGLDFHSWKWY